MIVLAATMLAAPPCPPMPPFAPLDLEAFADVLHAKALKEYPARRFPRERALDLAGALVYAGARFGVDPALLAAIGWHESRWRAGIAGDEGASVGLMQLGRRVRKVTRWARAGLPPVWADVAQGAAYLQRLRRRHPARWSAVYGCGNRCPRLNCTPMGRVKVELARTLRVATRTATTARRPR